MKERRENFEWRRNGDIYIYIRVMNYYIIESRNKFSISSCKASDAAKSV